MISSRLPGLAPERGRAPLAERSSAVTPSPPFETFLRFGYVVRGVIYLIPGALALQLALGTHGAAITPTGAIEMIGRQPFGRVLLVVIAVGLAGYVLWGLIRAILDPLGRGHSPGGILRRLGFVVSAFGNGGLLAATVGLIAGAIPHAARDWSSDLLARPLGSWLLGIIGVCWIAGAGILQIVGGWRGSFERDLDPARMNRAEHRWAMRLGRFGIVARGVVFTIIGVFLVTTALHANPGKEHGMDGALLRLSHEPFGRLLLGATALGLVLFGVFSVLSAHWMRVSVRRRASPA